MARMRKPPLNWRRINTLRTRCIPYSIEDLAVMKARAKAREKGLPEIVFDDPREGDEKPGRHPDGRGLYLQVRGQDNCSWLFRYEYDGKEQLIGLGSLKDWNLDQARGERDRLRQQLSKGLDPRAERDKELSARRAADRDREAKAVTFAEIHQRWWEKKRDEKAYTNPKHLAQKLQMLKTHAYPTIGNLVVGEITKAHMVKLFEQPNLKGKFEL